MLPDFFSSLHFLSFASESRIFRWTRSRWAFTSAQSKWCIHGNRQNRQTIAFVLLNFAVPIAALRHSYKPWLGVSVFKKLLFLETRVHFLNGWMNSQRKGRNTSWRFPSSRSSRPDGWREGWCEELKEENTRTAVKRASSVRWPGRRK